MEIANKGGNKMNIYCEEGTKVIFLNEGGFDNDTKEANKYLKEGETYTVDYIDVGGWISYVTLKECPNKSFNTVMFE